MTASKNFQVREENKSGAPKFLRRAALCMREWTWAFGSCPGSESIAFVDEEGRGLTFVDER